MERVCFLARVRPDRLAEYRAAHREVWPDMTAALTAAGWANYSIFLDDDGLLVGYLETEDYQAALRRMAETEVNSRWQAAMAPFFAGLGDRRPDEGFRRLTEIFHLD
ncbi:MAG TPA: L-rhamnose mutarotase [Streptosporangiaceae bacterium]